MEEWQNTWHDALEQLQDKQTIALISHIRPDGDAYGSLLALALALEQQGKKVLCYNQDGVLEKYAFLPGLDRIRTPDEDLASADVLIALDTSAPDRVGHFCWDKKIPVWLNIDHHISNACFGALNIIRPEVPATGQIVYDLIVQAGWNLTPEIAENIFVAISTDTGSFKYRGTTSATFEAAAALCRAGARPDHLARLTYSSFPMRRLKLQKAILNALQFHAEEQIAYYSITQKMYADCGALPEDTEGLLESIISTQGVHLAVVFEERPDQSVKMSFRSKGLVDVSRLASEIGGGGHREAAGAQSPDPLEKTVASVLRLCESYIAKIPQLHP